MARRALGTDALGVVRAVRIVLGDQPSPVTVGCSGGPDSLALTAATAYAIGRARVLIVDHGLQDNSDDVAEGVRRQLATWQQGLHGCDGGRDRDGGRGRVGAPGRDGFLEIVVVRATQVDGRGGPEAAARRARYRIFEESLAATGGVLLLGHTLDDQAEQLLLGLARGSGARSLGGMPARRGPYRRPLLGLRRAQTEAACAQFGLTPWRDPHNDDPRYARARVRTKVLPVLEAELGPGVAEALARSAEQLALDEELLDATSAELAAPETLAVPGLAEQHPAIRRRILRAWLLRRGASDLSMANIIAVDRLITDWAGQRFVEVPGLRVERSAGVLRIQRGR